MSSGADSLEGWDAIQRHLDRLESRAYANLVRSNKAKCKVLHMCWSNLQYWNRLRDEGIENRPEEDLGILVDRKIGHEL